MERTEHSFLDFGILLKNVSGAEQTLHFVELTASGPDKGGDLSAKSVRRLCLGIAPPMWLWVLGMSKDLIKTQGARPPEEGASLLAQVS